MFSVYSVKMLFLFPTNMKITFCQKSEGGLFPKNTPKVTFLALLKKMIFIQEKMILAL